MRSRLRLPVRFLVTAALCAGIAAARSAGAEIDLDQDGLDDTLERRLVANHLPWFHVDAGESDPSAAPFLVTGDPRETLLGTDREERLSTSCAWPLTPRRRGLALTRVTPATSYEALAWDPAASPPGLRKVEGSVDAARMAEQGGRRDYLIARVSLLFANDCGGSGRRVGWLGRGVNAHRGDDEAISLSLVRDPMCLPPEQGGATPGGDGWRVLEVVMSAHTGSEGLGLAWESVTRQWIDACDYGARFHSGVREAFVRGDPIAWDDSWNADTVRAPAAQRDHRNVLWLAMWKHGVYSSRAACNEGMPLPIVGPVEECRQEGWLQTFDVANVGEPAHPIDPDHALNAPEERDAGRFARLFPGEDPWEVRAPKEPDRRDGGFCGGFDRAQVVASDRWCMVDVVRHKLEGNVSIVGEGLWWFYDGCPDGRLCHRALLPFAPRRERPPPVATETAPRPGASGAPAAR